MKGVELYTHILDYQQITTPSTFFIKGLANMAVNPFVSEIFLIVVQTCNAVFVWYKRMHMLEEYRHHQNLSFKRLLSSLLSQLTRYHVINRYTGDYSGFSYKTFFACWLVCSDHFFQSEGSVVYLLTGKYFKKNLHHM